MLNIDNTQNNGLESDIGWLLSSIKITALTHSSMKLICMIMLQGCGSMTLTEAALPHAQKHTGFAFYG